MQHAAQCLMTSQIPVGSHYKSQLVECMWHATVGSVELSWLLELKERCEASCLLNDS